MGSKRTERMLALVGVVALSACFPVRLAGSRRGVERSGYKPEWTVRAPPSAGAVKALRKSVGYQNYLMFDHAGW